MKVTLPKTWFEKRIALEGDLDIGAGCPPLEITQGPQTPWAVYDSQDKCWLGTAAGVTVYTDKIVGGQVMSGELQCRFAITIANERCRRSTRFRMAIYHFDAKKYKDEVTPELTTEQALKNIEARA